MKMRQVLTFVKVEHTLFSLPFVLLGYLVAYEQFRDIRMSEGSPILHLEFVWILVAAIGARGLAMALNRIIDKEIDARNPRTQLRHLADGSMSMKTAWSLAVCFLFLLLLGAGMLNYVALMMAWLPVTAFVIYPYLKRFTWMCHFWLGLCLGLAPAGAWLAVAADVHGWSAITGASALPIASLWYPEVLLMSIGVLLWIAAFDLNYARMDIESDQLNGVFSFPARFGEDKTTQASYMLTVLWTACFIASNPFDTLLFPTSATVMGVANMMVIAKRESLEDFQRTLFNISMLTGWVLLFSGLVS